MTALHAVRLSVPDLRVDGLELRPLGEADLAQLLESPPDEEMRRWLTIHADPVTEDVLRTDLVLPSEDGWRSGRMAHFSIYDSHSGRLLGTISVRFYRHDIAEVGYDLLPHARGKGVATRTVRLVADWAFREVGVERLELRTHPDNVASRRVAERAGFTNEGIERASRRLYDERHDCVVYSLLPTDRPSV
ncbi:MAG: GNAT family N-acetyltransferase [Actinobacteria bacterium]|nr:GNAT family N-acetyltransferase [Actinomycetota bacterium]